MKAACGVVGNNDFCRCHIVGCNEYVPLNLQCSECDEVSVLSIVCLEHIEQLLYTRLLKPLT